MARGKRSATWMARAGFDVEVLTREGFFRRPPLPAGKQGRKINGVTACKEGVCVTNASPGDATDGRRQSEEGRDFVGPSGVESLYHAHRCLVNEGC